MNEIFDALQAEKNEGDLLIDRGFFFEVPKKSVLKWFSKKKTRRFVIQQPYGGALDMMSRIFLDIEFDENAIKDNPLTETKRLSMHGKKLAQAIAIAVLEDKWKIKLFSGLLTSYFFWRIKPNNLLTIIIGLTQISNLSDFIACIRLASRIRTTSPRVQEEQAA
ncbi:hypothetical protein [Emticicia sp. BO119]|uniref:hypothetical protein n=1 Tax=Emticicia sp. BO119 TaxID=2757768 RepID=UPI0015F05E86|nr:hypothetical protein [Emticicia sp. BO119]MBA4852079.1 hypothetical protein [Emticicia sp. BO119]